MKYHIKPALKKQRFGMGVKLLAPFIVLFILACGGTKKSGSEEATKDFQKLSELVNNREFEIENEWLTPLGGPAINLIGNPNYIRFEGDSVDVFLPYYGVRHSGGGYGTNGGIKYKGPAKNLNISKDPAKNSILLNFEGNDGNENLEFFITLFQGGSATTSVSSSQRESISYRGDVKALPEEN
ncbi:DUF4251 domain-containing protein [Gillisia limnaea]|uniref:DUF4251 domain-containing protein n=1 Tax=Gillisia limnaea (strain DSM 15749 / LMG 21470 / R-8282) TaxID=865937 RepID=H2BZ63_GILLR|nr:DUF4251 domain-containing protein [Gillisia limnaea]EHQ01192.1 hypothetical protein Gilli_0480 [Gillisia limnaea DSM 15749]